MAKQRMFNKVAKHLLTQKKKSRTRKANTWDDRMSTLCLYRGKDGLKCAIGCLIPNKLYDKGMEDNSVDELLTKWPKLNKLFEINSKRWVLDFLEELQLIHDQSHPNSWRNKLAELAEQHELSDAVLKI